MIPKNIITTRDLSRGEIDFILKTATQIEKDPEAFQDIYPDRLYTELFCEPSTRTRQSFLTAAEHLGMRVNGWRTPTGTSWKEKEESFHDTLRMFEEWGSDVIVMRHPKAGSARFASEVVEIPVISGGDDGHQHPTQTLLDLLTIYKEFGKLDGLTIGMMGDSKNGRTISSLAEALANYGNIKKIYFIAPDPLQVTHRPEVLLYLKQQGVPYGLVSDIRDVLPLLDVLYLTRIQLERMADEERGRVKDISYCVTADLLKDNGPQSHLIVMHPLPRTNELHPSVDETQHARYFRQAKNGLPTRIALLHLLLSGQCTETKLHDSIYDRIERGQIECPNKRCITHVDSRERQRGFVEPTFGLWESPEGPLLQCVYCDTLLTQNGELYRMV